MKKKPIQADPSSEYIIPTVDYMKKCTIQETENGYFLISTYTSGGEISHILTVVEEEDDDNKTLKKLLFRVAENFGYQYNKYGHENLEIHFNEKGHKME